MKYRFMFLFAVLFSGLLSASAPAAEVKWDTTPDGMPYCKVESIDDAAFLLGNYRIKVNTHSEPAWAAAHQPEFAQTHVH